MTTAWDLIGWDNGLLRIRGGRAVYEAVTYIDGRRLVRLERIAPTDGKLRVVTRYVDPDTELEAADDMAAAALAWWPDEPDPYDDPDGPLTEGGLRVCSRMCSTCIFRPGNLMQLHPGRVRGMVDEAVANDSMIPCHKTLDGERACCRGFYDRHRESSFGLRLGELIGVIEIDPDKDGEA